MTKSNRSNESRRGRGALAVLAIGAWLLVAPGAAQAVKIKGVSATPSTVQFDQTVNIKVTGKTNTKLCNVEISYGDSSLPETHNNVDFKNGKTLDVTHKYKAQDGAGAKAIQAKGVGGCTGNEDTSVTVQSGGGGNGGGGGITVEKWGGTDILKNVTKKKGVTIVPKPGVLQKLKMVKVEVEPHAAYANFKVKAVQSSWLELRVFGLPIPPTKHCNDTVNPYKATVTVGKQQQWNTQITGLSSAKKWFYEVCATNDQNITHRASGEFITLDEHRVIDIKNVPVEFGGPSPVETDN